MCDSFSRLPTAVRDCAAGMAGCRSAKSQFRLDNARRRSQRPALQVCGEPALNVCNLRWPKDRADKSPISRVTRQVPVGPRTSHRFNPPGDSICGKLVTEIPEKGSKIVLWARYFSLEYRL